MPPADAQDHRRFKLAMLAGCVLALLLFGWTAFMILHFDWVPASVRLGMSTVVKIASVALPGPVLLAFLGYTRKSRGSRTFGWIALIPAVAVPALLAWFATTLLRPAFSPQAYDAAAAEAETAALAMINADAPAARDLLAVRVRWKEQPTARDELAAMAARLRADAEQTRRAGNALAGLHAAVTAPFLARGVSKGRAEQFDKLFTGPISTAELERATKETADVVETFAARIELMVAHHGKWRWTGDGAIEFDDPEVNKAYDALIDAGAAAKK
jgi:hypothetical protein